MSLKARPKSRCVAGPRVRRRARVPFVFLVEDNQDLRELYAAYLAYRGLRVEMAHDGESAFRGITETRPDLVVLDLRLPRIDGWELTRQLKRDRRTSRIPVLVCTGYVLQASLERALDAGCDAYVLKPCLPERLPFEIRRVLARGGGPRIRRTSTKTVGP